MLSFTATKTKIFTFFVVALLKKTASSRIVIVASDLYKLAKLNLAKPNPTNQLPAYLYYVSKYANIMFSMELARRLKNGGSGNFSVMTSRDKCL